jgi:hypothetical protein
LALPSAPRVDLHFTVSGNSPGQSASCESDGWPRLVRYSSTALARTYQYFMQSTVENLRGAGYNAGFTPLEAAVGQYVTGHLDRDDRYR